MSNKVAKQKRNPKKYPLDEGVGRKPKTVSVLNLWYDDLQVISGKTDYAIGVETLTDLRDAHQADWFIDIDRRRKNHQWALVTDKQMRALLKGALVFMDA